MALAVALEVLLMRLCILSACVAFFSCAADVDDFALTDESLSSSSAIWTRQFGTNGLDEGKAVAVDSTGNIYVVGETFGALPNQQPSGTLDAFVRKYDATGREVWTSQFGSWDRDIAWDVAVSPTGEIYVSGTTEGVLPGETSAGGWDAFVRKYAPTGEVLWTRQFGGGGGETAASIAVNSQGRIYVAGSTGGALPGQTTAGEYDCFVRAYSSEGLELWSRQFGTPHADNARGIAIDSSGYLLVVGSTQGSFPGQTSSGNYDGFIRRYSPAGEELWTRQFGNQLDDYALGVAVNSDGAAYVVGSTQYVESGLPALSLLRPRQLGGDDAYLRLFDSSGNSTWNLPFGTTTRDEAWDVTLDAASNVYVAGSTAGALAGQSSAGGTDAFVRKFTGGGTEVWTLQYGSDKTDQALGIADTDAAVIATGSTAGRIEGTSAGDYDAYVRKLQP